MREGLGAEQLPPLLTGLWVAGVGWPGRLFCSFGRVGTQLVGLSPGTHQQARAEQLSPGGLLSCLSGMSGRRLTVRGRFPQPTVLQHHGHGRRVRASRLGWPVVPEVPLHSRFVLSPSSHHGDHLGI